MENNKDKYILHKNIFNDFIFTDKENYNARIQNAELIHTFQKCEGFETEEDVIEYVIKYFKIKRENIEIV